VAKLALPVAFGFAVRRLREDRRLSQEELGHLTGLHRNHVGQIERGEVTPTLNSIEVIAKALGMSASELLARAEELVD
jgi:transcriptional regulator with XRE-family HTH domain